MAFDERMESMLVDYHLGQLPEQEAGEVRRLLQDDPDFRERLEEVSLLLDLVPLSAPRSAPPAHVKERVVARVTGGAEREPRPNAGVPTHRPAAPAARTNRFRRFAPLLAAAALLIAILTPLTVSYLDLREENQRLEAEVRRLEAGDGEELKVADVEATDRAGGARGTVVLDPSTGELAFAAYDLPPAPTGHAYRAWLVDDAGARDLGEMSPDARGNVSMTGKAPDPQTAYRSLEVTVEPEGGAPDKSGPIYLQASL